MDNRPIGVFDSGLGGLTAVKELLRILPGEDIVYFGDTGRVPYGSRSGETITRYAVQDVSLLLRQQVKAVLCACGTVSSVAGQLLRSQAPCPFFEVVRPAAQAAAALSASGRIGIIGTSATIRSGKFPPAVREFRPDAQVLALPCPLFVPLVEAGHVRPDDPITRPAVELYLSPFKEAGVDTLILGCTHYPILAPAIHEFFGGSVALVDSGREAARAIREELERRDLLAAPGRQGSCRYLVSDSPEGFFQVAEGFLGRQIRGQVEKIEIGLLESLPAL